MLIITRKLLNAFFLSFIAMLLCPSVGEARSTTACIVELISADHSVDHQNLAEVRESVKD